MRDSRPRWVGRLRHAWIPLLIWASCGATVARDRTDETPGEAYVRGYVESWLLQSQELGSAQVRVEVRSGVVTLTGHVDTPERIARIDDWVGTVAGVREVINRLSLTEAAAAGASPEKSPSRWSTWLRWMRPPEGRKTVRFPIDDLFAPPLADQKQPRFHTTYQRYETESGRFNVASVGFGENFGVLRGPAAREGDGWQLGINGAVFAIFNLDAESNDLLNADYYVGLPWSWRHGRASARLRLFHLSSHLGDEFLLNPQPGPPVERINLSYEALEGLGSWERRGFRIYGGGIRILHSDTSLGRDRLQAGFEYLGSPLGWRTARVVAGIDVQAWDETGWDRDVSVKAGLRFRGPYGRARALMLLLEYYNGHAPHGQFFNLDVEYFGLGLTYSL